ncbi:MAG: FtsB family cell division protein, partial [Anaerovoracaceae bacterium]
MRKNPKVERPKRRKKRYQLKNRRTLIVFFVCLGILFLIGTTTYKLISVKMDEKTLLTQQESLLEQKARLKDELTHLNDPDYIEEQARNQLRLIMPGETIFILP